MAECTSHTVYAPYEYKGKTILIERYLLLGEQECPPGEYDLLDLKINPYAQEKMMEAEQNGYRGFSVFDDQSRELFNTFKYYTSPENKKIYLCAEITSKTKTKVLLCNVCAKYGKIWLNGKCMSVHHYDWAMTYYLSGSLNKGKNVILIEMYSPDDKAVLTVQIMNYRFEMSGNFRALSNMKSLPNMDPLMLIYEPVYVPEGDSFRFMYMLNDEKKYKAEYRIDIHDSNTGFVKSMTAKIGESVEIDALELRNLHEEKLRHEWIGCVFNEPDGKEFVSGLCIFTKDFHERADGIAAECVSLGKELPAEAGDHVSVLTTRLNDARKRKDDNGGYWTGWQIKDLLNQMKSGAYPYESYKTPGYREFFIHSDLDDSSIRVLERIPADYTGLQAYPVILALATANDGGFCWFAHFQNILKDFLIFDITGRGFTGGSYVGEASTLEVMDWVFKNFNIDRDRVYVLGQSNGGFSTWALAQNHPHIPAAIYPQIGYPAIESIENISNIPAYQVVSPKDHVFIGRTDNVKKRLKPYDNYVQYDFQEMLHHHFTYHIVHPAILENLTSHKRNLWPEHVIYRTPRNRHLESFWIKLHGIARGKYTGVTARIDSSGRISVRVQNTNGVTITLPPQIDRKGFEVVVNGHALSFSDYEKPTVIFRKEKGRWRQAESEPATDFRKGTGLLDIYMNSLRIIVPEGSDEAFSKIAENFSKPSSNGAFPEVFTKYPIYKSDDVPDHIFGHNLILLESAGRPNPYAGRFADKLPVKCDETGYTYRDVRTNSGYIVMQVIPNPYDQRRTCLIISTNDKKLLKKHMLLRKVIIPTYINGIHPLWNNEILTFDGKNYLAAYETGDALIPTKPGKADERR